MCTVSHYETRRLCGSVRCEKSELKHEGCGKAAQWSAVFLFSLKRSLLHLQSCGKETKTNTEKQI